MVIPPKFTLQRSSLSTAHRICVFYRKHSAKTIVTTSKNHGFFIICQALIIRYHRQIVSRARTNAPCGQTFSVGCLPLADGVSRHCAQNRRRFLCKNRRALLRPPVPHIVISLSLTAFAALREICLERIAVHGLVLQQVLRHRRQLRLVPSQYLTAFFVGLVDNGADLRVHLRRRLFGVGAGVGHGLADEHLVGAGVKGHVAQPGRHTVGAYHLAGDGRGPLDVAGSTGGDIAQHHLLGGAAAQQAGHSVQHIAAGQVGTVLLRQVDGHAAGLTAGDDGDLMYGVQVRQGLHDHGVTGLVIGSEPTLSLGHHAAVLLRAGDDLDDRLVDGLLGDEALAAAAGQQRRLVQQVLQIRTGKAGGSAGHGA